MTAAATGPSLLRRVLGTAVGACVGIVVVLLVVTVARIGTVVELIRGQQVANAPVLTSTHQAASASERSLRLIKSCVKPGGSCNKRSRKQTAGFLGSLNTQMVATAACEVVLSRESAGETAEQLATGITDCVTRTLALLERRQ